MPDTETVVPPQFPTVVVRTYDGDVTWPCEPIGEHLAIVPGFGMSYDPDAKTFHGYLTGSYAVFHRGLGKAITNEGCISCVRFTGNQLSALAVDWGALTPETSDAFAGSLNDEQQWMLAELCHVDCDVQWCEHPGTHPASTLWAVHVVGPDDIIAATDRQEAFRRCAEINQLAQQLRDRPDASANDPHLSARVVPWPGTPGEHAKEIARGDERWEA